MWNQNHYSMIFLVVNQTDQLMLFEMEWLYNVIHVYLKTVQQIGLHQRSSL